MREIPVREVTAAVTTLCSTACITLGRAELAALQSALAKETSPAAKHALEQLIENARVADAEKMPLCQDTGFAVIFLEVGQDVHFTGGSLTEAVNEGVRQGYGKAYLRSSIVASPVERVNTGDNTPAVIHTEIVPGDKVRITFDAKGGGSENMSAVGMLTPADGREGVIDFAVECVKKAGANPCPPVIVGVAAGGTFEKAALLAKKALLRELGAPNPDRRIAAMEEEILDRVNRLGIGACGFGGVVTALAVHVEEHPCHIASLPVAVNIDCHAHRHGEAVL